MNARRNLAIGVLLATAWAGTAMAAPVKATARPDPRAKQLLEQIDDLWRGATSHARITMQVKTAHYERKLRMEAWSRGKEQSLVRILSPRREQGTATLKAGTRIYTWLPRTARVIRLTAGMMGGSWMGNHFSNDDLVKESRMSDDYTYRITFEGKRKGRAMIELTLLPLPDAAVVWGKLVVDINAADKLPLRTRYFDEKGKLARTMTFSAVRQLAGRKRPATLRITPADKPSEFTEIRYDSLEIGLKLDPSFFSIQRLKRR